MPIEVRHPGVSPYLTAFSSWVGEFSRYYEWLAQQQAQLAAERRAFNRSLLGQGINAATSAALGALYPTVPGNTLAGQMAQGAIRGAISGFSSPAAVGAIIQPQQSAPLTISQQVLPTAAREAVSLGLPIPSYADVPQEQITPDIAADIVQLPNIKREFDAAIEAYQKALAQAPPGVTLPQDQVQRLNEMVQRVRQMPRDPVYHTREGFYRYQEALRQTAGLAGSLAQQLTSSAPPPPDQVVQEMFSKFDPDQYKVTARMNLPGGVNLAVTNDGRAAPQKVEISPQDYFRIYKEAHQDVLMGLAQKTPINEPLPPDDIVDALVEGRITRMLESYRQRFAPPPAPAPAPVPVQVPVPQTPAIPEPAELAAASTQAARAISSAGETVRTPEFQPQEPEFQPQEPEFQPQEPEFRPEVYVSDRDIADARKALGSKAADDEVYSMAIMIAELRALTERAKNDPAGMRARDWERMQFLRARISEAMRRRK